MPIVRKTVAIHPIMDSYIRKTWAILIERGKDASYSTALNFMLLMAIIETKRPDGLSKETLETIWNFVEDQKTIDVLNLQDLLATLSEKLRA